MKQIILEEPEIRLNILRHIFGIDKYKTIRENLSILLSKYKDDSKILQGEIMSLEPDKTRLLSTTSFITVLEQKIGEQEEKVRESIFRRKEIEVEVLELESKIKEKDMLELELEKAKVMLGTKKDSIAQSKREYMEIQSSLNEIKIDFDEKELDILISKINRLSKDIEFNQAMYIDSLSTLNSLKIKKSDALSKKERVFKIDICPTCLQDVPMAHKHNILNETEQLISSISKDILYLEEKSKEYSPIIEKLKTDKNNLENRKFQIEISKVKIPQLEKSRQKLSEIVKSLENYEKDTLLLTNHLDNLKKNILDYSRYSNLYKAKQEELKKAFLNEKNNEISLAELKKELELTHKEILLLEKSIREKQSKKEKLMEIMELSDWLSNHFLNLINYTERNVMMKLRIEFSNLFSKWFLILVQETFEVQLDENFTPIILQNGVEMDYSYLSGGERTAVALAYRLALNQTINSVMTTIKTRDIVILDEPTEGFSEGQIEKIRDILIELNSKQLIIVSHEQKIEGFVDNVIKIRKENNSSRMED